MTSSKVAFSWTDEHQTVFIKLKEALSSPSFLDYPRRSDKFVLTTDASGAALSISCGTVVDCTLRKSILIVSKNAWPLCGPYQVEKKIIT